MRADFACGPEHARKGAYRVEEEDLDVCPMHELRHGQDAFARAVLGIAADRQLGVCGLWPDGFSAATVDAVRLLESERDDAQARSLERGRSPA